MYLGGGRSLSGRDLKTFANQSAWLVTTRGKWGVFYFHLVLNLFCGMCRAIYTNHKLYCLEIMYNLERSVYSITPENPEVIFSGCVF